jgi:hypothetical protein
MVARSAWQRVAEATPGDGKEREMEVAVALTTDEDITQIDRLPID